VLAVAIHEDLAISITRSHATTGVARVFGERKGAQAVAVWVGRRRGIVYVFELSAGFAQFVQTERFVTAYRQVGPPAIA
jgi:uncharacterized protein YpmB